MSNRVAWLGPYEWERIDERQYENACSWACEKAAPGFLPLRPTFGHHFRLFSSLALKRLPYNPPLPLYLGGCVGPIPPSPLFSPCVTTNSCRLQAAGSIIHSEMELKPCRHPQAHSYVLIFPEGQRQANINPFLHFYCIKHRGYVGHYSLCSTNTPRLLEALVHIQVIETLE